MRKAHVLSPLKVRQVFVPFLGDFLSIAGGAWRYSLEKWFSSPFLGTFFQ